VLISWQRRGVQARLRRSIGARPATSTTISRLKKSTTFSPAASGDSIRTLELRITNKLFFNFATAG